VHVVSRRWWDPVPKLGRSDASLLGGRLNAARAALPGWPEPTDPAADRLRAGRAALASVLAGAGDLAGAVQGLVGLGAGLTPAGDDLLSGAMAGLVVFGTALKQQDALALAASMRQAVAEHAGGTTPLAADLADHAARGALVQPAANLCRAIGSKRPDADRLWKPALERLLRLGHTSGHDLAEGLLLSASNVIGRTY
jgi:hypothetical protein